MKYGPALDLVAENHEERRESHWESRHNHQLKSDETFFHQSPDFRHLVGLTKAFHPGDHDAGSRPQGKNADPDEELGLHRLGAGDVLCDRGVGAFGKNTAHRAKDLTHEDPTALRTREY